MLRHRVVVLRVLAARSVTQRGTDGPAYTSPQGKTSSSSRAATGSDDGVTNATTNHEQPAFLNVVRQHDPQDAAIAAHHSPVQGSASRKMYSKEGYNFMEHLRTSGAGAALGRVRWTLSVYVAIGVVLVLYAVYYLTTYTYVLTTNPAPYRNSLFQHFPCDLAIVENKFTGKRHVVEVTPAISPLLRDGAAEGDAMAAMDGPDASGHARSEAATSLDGDESVENNRAETLTPTHFVRPAPAIVERQLHVNALLHRVYLYLQKSHSLVLVDAQAELNPQRFMNRANSVGREARAPVGFLRADQLLPDPNDRTDPKQQSESKKGNEKRSWWQWATDKAKTSKDQNTADSSVSNSTNIMRGAAKPPKQIYIESEVRLRDAMNGYQKGHLYTYEQTMTHIVQEKLTQRFYNYVLERGMSEHRGLRKLFAEEMIRNGLINGAGVTVAQLVPDVHQFADEVFDDLKAQFGDDVIVYQYSVQLY